MTAPESASRDRAPSPAKLAIEVLAGAIVLLVLWRLRNVALLCFAAIIFAALLRGLADPLTRKTRLRSRWAILIVIVVLASSFTIAMWRTGAPMLAQLQELRNTVPRAWATALHWLQGQPFGPQIMSWTSDAAELKVPWARGTVLR